MAALHAATDSENTFEQFRSCCLVGNPCLDSIRRWKDYRHKVYGFRQDTAMDYSIRLMMVKMVWNCA